MSEAEPPPLPETDPGSASGSRDGVIIACAAAALAVSLAFDRYAAGPGS